MVVEKVVTTVLFDNPVLLADPAEHGAVQLSEEGIRPRSGVATRQPLHHRGEGKN